MAHEATRWLDIAAQDLKAVRNNLFGPEPTMDIAAYHCQQAAEKMVKAALIATGIDPPRWHNIDELVDLLPADHPLRAELEPLGQLTPYAIAFRYPIPDPDAAPDLPKLEDVKAWLHDLERANAVVAAVIGAQA